ncbi:MAG: RHS repeat protein [Lachnospiraceae bacterium]|nr:RHS repeat protein [Lachnospiraceae bacterium]
MRKRLLCLFAILLCFSIVTGFSAISLAQEEEESIQYEYDELNRVTKAIYPDGTTVTYCYDKNGNLLETIVTPPEEETASTAGEANTTEGMISDREIPEQGAINQEYAFNFSNQDKKTENGVIDLEADGVSDIVLNDKNQAAGKRNKWYWGWIPAVILAALLTAGVVWRNRRRKQDEN